MRTLLAEPGTDAAMDTEPLVVRGPTHEAALAAAEVTFGRPARAVKADRIRRGGIAGFFATDMGVEVTAVPVELPPRPVAAPAHAPAPVPVSAPPMKAIPMHHDAQLSHPSHGTDDPDAPLIAALERLLTQAGSLDGPAAAALLTGATSAPQRTPVRDPQPHQESAPTTVRSLNAPTALRTSSPAGAAATVAAARFATTQVAAQSVAASPVASTQSSGPSHAQARPAAAPTAAGLRRPNGLDRNAADMAASAAGDLLGRVLDRHSGSFEVTVTIAGPDGTKTKAEARADRTEDRHGAHGRTR